MNTGTVGWTFKKTNISVPCEQKEVNSTGLMACCHKVDQTGLAEKLIGVQCFQKSSVFVRWENGLC